jgi:hypothetical protein
LSPFRPGARGNISVLPMIDGDKKGISISMKF